MYTLHVMVGLSFWAVCIQTRASININILVYPHNFHVDKLGCMYTNQDYVKLRTVTTTSILSLSQEHLIEVNAQVVPDIRVNPKLQSSS